MNPHGNQSLLGLFFFASYLSVVDGISGSLPQSHGSPASLAMWSAFSSCVRLVAVSFNDRSFPLFIFSISDFFNLQRSTANYSFLSSELIYGTI